MANLSPAAVSRTTSGSGLSSPSSFSGELYQQQACRTTNLSPDERTFHQVIESDTGSVTDLQNIMKKIINSKDDEHRTPLHKAVTKGDTEMFEYLIDNGAEINAQDVDGRTPLYEAAIKGNPTMVAKLMIQKETIGKNTHTLNKYDQFTLKNTSSCLGKYVQFTYIVYNPISSVISGIFVTKINAFSERLLSSIHR